MRLAKTLIFRDQPPAALAELPLSQLRCVRILEEHEGEKMQELAHHLGVTLPAISQIVDRLAARGMAERRADSDDRRIVRLFLTDSARQLLQEGQEERCRRIQRAIALLSAGETESTIIAMERLAQAAEDTRVSGEPEESQSAAVLEEDIEIASRAPRIANAPFPGLSPINTRAGQ